MPYPPDNGNQQIIPILCSIGRGVELDQCPRLVAGAEGRGRVIDFFRFLASSAGIVGCWRVKTRVKTTDMCLPGRHVANMLAKMLATRLKKLLAGVPLMLGQHVTC
jgi:hypothetical protein